MLFEVQRGALKCDCLVWEKEIEWRRGRHREPYWHYFPLILFVLHLAGILMMAKWPRFLSKHIHTQKHKNRMIQLVEFDFVGFSVSTEFPESTKIHTLDKRWTLRLKKSLRFQLSELLQWLHNESSWYNIQHIKDHIDDVLWYCVPSPQINRSRLRTLKNPHFDTSTANVTSQQSYFYSFCI